MRLPFFFCASTKMGSEQHDYIFKRDMKLKNDYDKSQKNFRIVPEMSKLKKDDANHVSAKISPIVDPITGETTSTSSDPMAPPPTRYPPTNPQQTIQPKTFPPATNAQASKKSSNVPEDLEFSGMQLMIAVIITAILSSFITLSVTRHLKKK